jgi:hypothetical protein
VKISAHLRRALHEALDLVLNALAEGATEPPRRRTRTVKEPPLPDIEVSEEAMVQARARWEKAGWRKR